MKLFKPKGKGFFNKDSLAIIDIKNIDGTDGLLVTYKDGSQVVYENYDKVVDRKGLVKETFATAISSFGKLNNLKNEIINNIQIGDIIYYNGEFIVVDQNIINKIKLDIFNDGSCIACYPFDGNANDLSGNYNGEWSGTEQYDNSEFGQVAKFDGNSYIEIENNIEKYFVENSPFSISCWFNFLDLNQTWSRVLDFKGKFLITHNGTTNYLTIHHRKNEDYSGINIIDKTTDFKYNLSSNTYYFIAITFDGNNYNLYIQNDKLNITPQNLSASEPTENVLKNYFAKSNWSADGIAQIEIGQVRIFNRALTDEEIQILYNEQSTPLIKKLSL